jgi:hypothetical protein
VAVESGDCKPVPEPCRVVFNPERCQPRTELRLWNELSRPAPGRRARKRPDLKVTKGRIRQHRRSGIARHTTAGSRSGKRGNS